MERRRPSLSLDSRHGHRHQERPSEKGVREVLPRPQRQCPRRERLRTRTGIREECRDAASGRNPRR